MIDSNKFIWFSGSIVVAVLLFQMLPSGDINYPNILPESGYCTEKGLDISYTTISLEEGNIPVEYCKLSDLCEEAYYVIAPEGNDFNEVALNEFISAHSDMFCFKDEAKHTQRDRTDEFEGRIKVMFACCNVEDSRQGLSNVTCESNICDGRFTGNYEQGCRIYATLKNGQYVNTCGGVAEFETLRLQ